MRSQLFQNPHAVIRACTALFRLLAIALAVLSFGSVAGAQTVTRYTNTTDSAAGGINSSATPCTNTFKRTFSVGTSFTVADVNVGVLVAHTYRGDLAMFLRSPAGTRIQLTDSATAGSRSAVGTRIAFALNRPFKHGPSHQSRDDLDHHRPVHTHE